MRFKLIQYYVSYLDKDYTDALHEWRANRCVAVANMGVFADAAIPRGGTCCVCDAQLGGASAPLVAVVIIEWDHCSAASL